MIKNLLEKYMHLQKIIENRVKRNIAGGVEGVSSEIDKWESNYI